MMRTASGWWPGGFCSNWGTKSCRPRSGLRALEIYRQERDRIDLVILDMLMPGMGGAETFQKLKGIDPGVRVLLSSGYSLDGEAQQVMAAGARGFIQKPYRLAVLSHKVTETSAGPEARRTTGRFRRPKVQQRFCQS